MSLGLTQLLSTAHDMFATKGAEYLLVIAYLVLLVPFWRLLARIGQEPTRASARASGARAVRWFEVPDGVSLHPGHAWARAEGGNLVRVGLDAFASRLVGAPSAVSLPAVGVRVGAGRAAWSLTVEGRPVPMLSPVDGEVVATNDAVLTDPSLATSDPYGAGWLMTVRVPAAAGALSGLLRGATARRWLDGAAEALRARFAQSGAGLVLQDGGEPVAGFVRELSPDRWHDLAAELLLTKEE